MHITDSLTKIKKLEKCKYLRIMRIIGHPKNSCTAAFLHVDHFGEKYGLGMVCASHPA